MDTVFSGSADMSEKVRAVIARWKEAHDLQLKLCDELEAIADSLPTNIDPIKCLGVAKCLGAVVKDVHRFEEDDLFPTLTGRPEEAGSMAATFERLKFEHLIDESYADDLTERLLYLGHGGLDVNMEATGYMLRGFFEALRRHIAFEQDYFARYLAPMSPLH